MSARFAIQHADMDSPTTDKVLRKADFISDCQTTIDEVCGKMDAKCSPYSCTKLNVLRPTTLEALGIAFANTQVAAAILFAAFAFLATIVRPRD